MREPTAAGAPPLANMPAKTLPPAQRVCIKDVARRARVSSGTVSHVLTGHVQVSETLRARVEKAIAALGYVPNFHAQGLRGSHSRVIGLCIPHASTGYLATLSEALEEIVSAAGYGVMHVFSRHDPATELDRIADLIRYRVDGLVLVPSMNPSRALDLAANASVPLVIVDRPSGDRRFDQVTLDNRAAMRAVVEPLIALGHKRLIYIFLSRNRIVTRHRLQGLTAACEEHPGVTFQTIEFQDDLNFLRDEIARALEQRSPPTAWVVSTSHYAAHVLGFLGERGVRSPDDVSIVTFDDPEWSMLVRPQLSVVRQPARAIAHVAWDLLLARINGATDPPRAVALTATIELRASVAPPRAAPAATPRVRRAKAASRA